MSDAYRVATDALIEASKVSGGSAYVAGMDDALCSNQAFVVVTALRDAGYLIEGGETRDEQFGVEWSGDVSPKVDWPYDADEVANQRDWKDPGHADTRIVKRTRIVGPWRPVEEESNDDDSL